MFGNIERDVMSIRSGMARATLTVSIPEDVWIGDVSRTHSNATIRVLAALSDDVGVGLSEIVASDLSAVIDDIRNSEEVTSVEVLHSREDRAIVQFETTTPMLLMAAQDSGVPLEMPFDINDGKAVWEITAPQSRLSKLGQQLDALGVRYTVDALQQHVEDAPLLTECQRELVARAIELGYYDTPRTCTLTELADAVDIAKSTCSETLHRAEEKILKQFAADHQGIELEGMAVPGQP